MGKRISLAIVSTTAEVFEKSIVVGVSEEIILYPVLYARELSTHRNSPKIKINCAKLNNNIVSYGTLSLGFLTPLLSAIKYVVYSPFFCFKNSRPRIMPIALSNKETTHPLFSGRFPTLSVSPLLLKNNPKTIRIFANE